MKDIPLAKEMMEVHCPTLMPDQEIYDVVHQLSKRKISGAPVVDKNRLILGYLSERDCMKTLIDCMYDANPTTTAQTCMTQDFATIPDDADALVIAEHFLRKPYSHLLVVQDGKLAGQISRGAFLESLAEWTRPEQADKYKRYFLYLSQVAERSGLTTD